MSTVSSSRTNGAGLGFVSLMESIGGLVSLTFSNRIDKLIDNGKKIDTQKIRKTNQTLTKINL